MEIASFAQALAGPQGAMVLLAIVLWMVWKLANRGIDVINSHLARIEKKFDELNAAMQTRLFEVKESIEEMQHGVQSANRKLRLIREEEKENDAGKS